MPARTDTTVPAAALRLAVATALALVLALALLPAPRAHAASCAYGQLCARYESSNDPSCIDPNCAYGTYQMDVYNTTQFMTWLNTSSTSPAYYKRLHDAYVKDKKSLGSNFDAAWRKIAAEDKAGFTKMQYAYVKKYYYDAAVVYWKKVAPGFSPSSYSVALRNVIFSTAVQHGPYGSAYYILQPALKTAGGWSTSMKEEVLIRAVYAERARVQTTKPYKNSTVISKKDATAVKYGIAGKYLSHFSAGNSSAVQVGVYIRLAVNEPQAAVAMMVAVGACTHAYTSGGKVSYSHITDATHVEKRSGAVCTTCGKTVTKFAKRTVKNSFKKSGAAWRDASGASYTVHAKRYYTVKADSLNVRSKAKTTASVRTSVARGKVLRVTRAVMGKDGFWWGRVKVHGSTGYVQMRYLSVLGTASGKHKYVKGRDRYSKATRAQVARAKAIAKKGSGTFALAQQSQSYAYAYGDGKAAKRTYQAGAQVTVSKVVKNAYNNWWALLSNGEYLPLTALQ